MVPSIAMYQKNSIKHQLFIYTQLNDQTFLLQAIQFGMSFVWIQFKCQSTQFKCQNSSIWRIDKTLQGSSTPGLSEPGSDGNEGVVCILQSSSITGASASDYLVS